MREIKFRVWDKTGKFMSDCDFTLADVAANIDDIGEKLLGKNTSIEWMQFIGLKDKNSKEIYEGDIVRLTTYGVNDLRKIQAVEWSDDRTGFVTSHSPFIKTNAQRTFDADCDWLFECEVIGNIHENPGLLENKK